MTTNRIEFYGARNDYGELSNFAPYPIYLDRKCWPTTEHYFQAQKFPGTHHAEEIRKAKSPGRAKKLGRSRDLPIRADWESIKDDVMYRCVKAKFTQHDDLKALLIETGDAILVEHTSRDYYWGDGGDGTGKNRLGVILMRVRDELVAEAD